MFLEDELEEIQTRDIEVVEKARAFLHAMGSNIEKSVIVRNGRASTLDLANVIRRIDNTWRKFAKKHGYKESFFRNKCSDTIKKISEETYALLGWEEGEDQ